MWIVFHHHNIPGWDYQFSSEQSPTSLTRGFVRTSLKSNSRPHLSPPIASVWWLKSEITGTRGFCSAPVLTDQIVYEVDEDHQNLGEEDLFLCFDQEKVPLPSDQVTFLWRFFFFVVISKTIWTDFLGIFKIYLVFTYHGLLLRKMDFSAQECAALYSLSASVKLSRLWITFPRLFLFTSEAMNHKKPFFYINR